MRKIFLSLLFLMPFTLSAQSWRIAATGGVMLNTATSNPSFNEKMPNEPGGAATVQLGYLRNGWEAGAAVSYSRYALRHEGDLVFEDDFGGSGTITVEHYDAFETIPIIAVTPFVRRHFGNGKTDFYTGLSAGVTSLPWGTGAVLAGEHFLNEKKPAPGFTAGINGGCNYSIFKGWALRGEISIDGVWLKTSSLQGAMLTVGIQHSW